MKYFQRTAVFAVITTIYIGVVQCSSELNSTIRNSDGSLKRIHEIMQADRATLNLWIQEVGDVNHEDEGDIYHQGGTALMWAIVFGKKDDVEYLIEKKGANIDQEVRQTGETPLVTAIRNDKTDIVEYLIRKGANVNYVNPQKEYDTPLTWAILNGNQRVVQLLLDYGAKLRGDIGTELIWAVTNESGNLISTQTNIELIHKYNFEMVEFLLRNRADTSPSNCDGNTALHIAAGLDAGKQPEKIIEYLLRWGANRQLRNEFGQLPLDIATKTGNAKTIARLSTNRLQTRYTRTGKQISRRFHTDKTFIE